MTKKEAFEILFNSSTFILTDRPSKEKTDEARLAYYGKREYARQQKLWAERRWLVV